MNNKLILALLFAVLLLSSTVFSKQDMMEGSDEEIVQEDVQQQQQNNDDIVMEDMDKQAGQGQQFHFDGEGDLQEQLKQFQEQMAMQEQQKKNMQAICIIVAKTRINQEMEFLQKLFAKNNGKDGGQGYRKIQAEHVNHCMTTFDGPTFQAIASGMNDQSFDIKNYEQNFMELTFSRYESDDFNFELTTQEEELDTVAKEFEEEWKQMQDSQKEKEDIEKQKKYQEKKANSKKGKKEKKEKAPSMSDFEPKIFGYSYTSIPAYVKFSFLLLVISTVVGVVYFGYQKIQNEQAILSKSQKKKLLKAQKAQ